MVGYRGCRRWWVTQVAGYGSIAGVAGDGGDGGLVAGKVLEIVMEVGLEDGGGSRKHFRRRLRRLLPESRVSGDGNVAGVAGDGGDGGLVTGKVLEIVMEVGLEDGGGGRKRFRRRLLLGEDRDCCWSLLSEFVAGNCRRRRWVTDTFTKLDTEEDIYTKDGTINYKNNPANRKKTGTWKACPFILGKSFNSPFDFIQSNLVLIVSKTGRSSVVCRTYELFDAHFEDRKKLI
ncbi:hypothetical protein OSB04_023496 [Centaurea solstitialis]|uniref:Uncharacterized protein n=1 Tax=Centaurea solstitialis TaxID=347529 RepID=A0AA38SKY5_9ASTR|nr:hypothetical protein OSB04_023496 [Centaurea solstitialis]